MIGTLEFLRESFNRFNSEIFGNNLPVPILKISNARTFLGKFQHKKQWGKKVSGKDRVQTRL